MALYQYRVISTHSEKEMDFITYNKPQKTSKVMEDFCKKWKLQGKVNKSSFRIERHNDK